jgi:integrase
MLTTLWAPVVAAAFPDGRKVDLYELRHFCAHHLYVTQGLPARVVAVQLGHNDGGRLVERLYGHGDVGALEEIDRAFSRVVSIESARSGSQGG